jgi:hypothetical protein
VPEYIYSDTSTLSLPTPTPHSHGFFVPAINSWLDKQRQFIGVRRLEKLQNGSGYLLSGVVRCIFVRLLCIRSIFTSYPLTSFRSEDFFFTA